MLSRPFRMYLIGHTVLERLVWSIMVIKILVGQLIVHDYTQTLEIKDK